MSGRSVPSLGWLHNGAGRSVLIVALFHSAFNSVGDGADYATRFIEELTSGPAAPLIPISVVVVIAMVIVLTRGPSPAPAGVCSRAKLPIVVRGARGR